MDAPTERDIPERRSAVDFHRKRVAAQRHLSQDPSRSALLNGSRSFIRCNLSRSGSWIIAHIHFGPERLIGLSLRFATTARSAHLLRAGTVVIDAVLKEARHDDHSEPTGEDADSPMSSAPTRRSGIGPWAARPAGIGSANGRLVSRNSATQRDATDARIQRLWPDGCRG